MTLRANAALTALMVAFIGLAQTGVKAQQAFVLCEGAQDFYSGEVLESPRLGTFQWDAEEPSFEVLHVFEGHSFAVDCILDEAGEEVFVSAEDTVYRMNALTGEILAQQALEGARKLLLTDDQLLVTRGDYDPVTFGSVAFDQFLVSLDRTDLSWQAGWEAGSGDGPAFASESMAVVNGVVYVAINNAFAYGQEVGLMGRLDLVSGEYSELDLGPEGLNPVHLFATDEGVVSVNARQYESTSLSSVDSGSEVSTLVVAETTAGCGAAAIMDDEVVFQVYGEGDFRKADANVLTAGENWPGNGLSAYSMCVVPGFVMLGGTDFASTGSIDVMDMNGELLSSLSTGIAPGKIVASPQTSSVSNAMGIPSEVKVETGRFDLLGRPCATGHSGLQVVRFLDGTAETVFRLAD